MSIFRPARRPLVVLAGAVALGAAGCSADEAATAHANFALIGLFLCGLFVALLQLLATTFALVQRRPRGTIAYGATTFLAVIGGVGGVMAAVTVSDLPARLRPRVGESLLFVLGEVVVVVGAWFLATLLRYGMRHVPPSPEVEELSPGMLLVVRLLVVGSAVLFLAGVVLGYWLLIHGDPTAVPHR